LVGFERRVFVSKSGAPIMGDDSARHDVSDDKQTKVSSVSNPYLKRPTLPFDKEIEGDSFVSIHAAPSDAFLPAAPVTAQHDEQEEETVAETTETTSDPEKQTFGHKDSAIDRLPSRNVSFGSAEILTVSELQKHAPLYLDLSVRITGVVLHRHVATDGNVCLILKDPSMQQQRSEAPRSILKTPGGIKKRRRSGVGTTPRFVTGKRPLSSLKKAPPPPNPVEAMLNSLMTQSTVLIYAVSKQMPVNEACVNDLIMIIGEVKTAPVPALEDILEKWNAKSSDTVNLFVYARILRNVNGTDMRLHDEALRMRRQHLIQSSAQSSSGEEELERLRPGCGPPPYHNARDSTKEMNV
jgi:hypothetical protein